jgi:peroxiredoxin
VRRQKMRLTRWVVGGVILLGVLSSFLLWGERATAVEDPLEDLYSSLGIVKIASPVKAWDFTLEDLEGSPVSIKDFRGKLVFLNFWATWCGFCRKEMPSIERLWQKFKEEDFVILAVDVEEGGDWVRPFVEENGYTFPILLDPTGEVAETYRIPQLPTTYLIDPEGMIFAGIGQERDWATKDVFELIEHLLPKTEANGS